MFDDKISQKIGFVHIYNTFRNKKFNILDNLWQGYGTKEQVNVDFVFVEKHMKEKFDYQIIKQNDMSNEGSDHRPIILTIE